MRFGTIITTLLISFLLIAGCARKGMDAPAKQNGAGRPFGSNGKETSNVSRVPMIMNKKLNVMLLASPSDDLTGILAKIYENKEIR